MMHAEETSSTDEQTFQKDFQRCEVTMLDQSVTKLKTHLLAYAVLWKSCEKENP
jgi:hypothetical protein